MLTNPEAPVTSEGSAEIGPPPYYHRSDCNICRKQDGVKTGSDEGELRGVDYLAQRPPLTTSYSEAEAMSRKIRAQFEAS
jgi:hypothetical protein